MSDDYRNDVNDDEDFASLQGERREEAFSSLPPTLPPLGPRLFVPRGSPQTMAGSQWPVYHELKFL